MYTVTCNVNINTGNIKKARQIYGSFTDAKLCLQKM